MSNSKTKYKYSDLICLECGNVFTIQRRIGDGKKIGHIKHMYCHRCKDIRGFYEVRDVSLFMFQYNDVDDNMIDINTRRALELLKKREDESVREEDRVFKKVLTRK